MHSHRDEGALHQAGVGGTGDTGAAAADKASEDADGGEVDGAPTTERKSATWRSRDGLLGSTLTTSAPASASNIVATGPAMPLAKSTIRMPSRMPSPMTITPSRGKRARAAPPPTRARRPASAASR